MLVGQMADRLRGGGGGGNRDSFHLVTMSCFELFHVNASMVKIH